MGISLDFMWIKHEKWYFMVFTRKNGGSNGISPTRTEMFVGFDENFMGLNHQKSVLALAEFIDQWKMQGGAPKIAKLVYNSNN